MPSEEELLVSFTQLLMINKHYMGINYFSIVKEIACTWIFCIIFTCTALNLNSNYNVQFVLAIIGF